VWVRVLPVAVQVERADRVGDHVEDAEHPSGDVASGFIENAGELNNDSNEIEEGGNARVQQLREQPVYGECDGLLQVEQIDETPQQRGDEGGHYHEQEPVCAAGPRRRRTGHADDAESQFHKFDNPGGGFEIGELQRDARAGGFAGGGVGGGAAGGIVGGHLALLRLRHHCWVLG